jgi:hypothetical protein
MQDSTLPPAGSSDTPPAQLPDLPPEASLLAEGRIPYRPKERTLEAAPLLLGKAAWVLVIGAALPWCGHQGTWVTSVAAKLVVALGCFLFYAAVVARTGAPVPAGLGALTKPRLGPELGAKAKTPVQKIFAVAPTPLHLLAWAFALGGLFLPLLDPARSAVPSDFEVLQAFVEVGSLLLGAGTVVHIFAYRKGAHFNPLFPLLFLGPAFLGTSIVLQTLGGGNLGAHLVELLGSLLSAGAGLFAVYTVVLALMAAKKEGDAKKAQALEARKAARASKRDVRA